MQLLFRPSMKLLLALALIATATMSRLLPHPPNVAPIAALALLGGSSLRAPWSVLLPASAMFTSDLIIGFDALPMTLAIYGSFLFTVWIGSWLPKRPSAFSMLGGSLAASILFYLVTNAAVWWYSGMYERTLDGLILSYTLAIPFFRNTLLGDLVYSVTLLSVYYYAQPVLVWSSARLHALRRQSREMLEAGQ